MFGVIGILGTHEELELVKDFRRGRVQRTMMQVASIEPVAVPVQPTLVARATHATVDALKWLIS